MSSPWDPAIAQAMQRHGGSNRSIPKTQSKPPKEPYGSIAAVQGQDQVQIRRQDQLSPSDKPDTPEAGLA